MEEDNRQPNIRRNLVWRIVDLQGNSSLPTVLQMNCDIAGTSLAVVFAPTVAPPSHGIEAVNSEKFNEEFHIVSP
mgnify:CR=1 FL=1